MVKKPHIICGDSSVLQKSLSSISRKEHGMTHMGTNLKDNSPSTDDYYDYEVDATVTGVTTDELLPFFKPALFYTKNRQPLS
ncbi:CFC_HP_G0061950.mRNA.1.CDS.1 [Saccharomyces cerevisiae]|nr:CFC_HP_G0061950.mRNA.1.CDS.1 [Saccharomyces cerevisiae]CAI6587753.1 CFC_HP_G0061950.mRNA.1.CDS.1 [Saccharomyces cerevisiae]